MLLASFFKDKKKLVTGKLRRWLVFNIYVILILVTWLHVSCAICCCQFENQDIPVLLIQSPNPKEELLYHVASPLQGSLPEKQQALF